MIGNRYIPALLTKARFGVLLLLATVFASGCASNPQVPSDTSPPGDLRALNQWLDTQLIPDLVKATDGHPRFEAESVAIVKMSGTSVVQDVDGLTDHMRNRIEDALLGQSGLKLIWRRPDSSGNCDVVEDAAYYLGVDTKLDAGKINVRVRMLDSRDNAWVPKLVYTWAGNSNARAKKLYSTSASDSVLVGSRHAPISNADLDIAASRLAQQLGCKISKHKRLANISVAPEFPEDIQRGRVQPIVSNYLQRQPEMALATQKGDTDYQIKWQWLHLNSKLSQLWLQPHATDSAVPVDGVNVYLSSEVSSTAASNAAEQPPAAVTTASATPAPQNATVENNKIAHFRLYTPPDLSLCSSSNPWSQGRKVLADRAALPSGSCFALSYSLAQNSQVYLLHEGPDGKLTRLAPDNCEVVAGDAVAARTERWFPPANSGQILDLDSITGLESFHILTLGLNSGVSGLANRMNALPSLGSKCGVPKGITLRDTHSKELAALVRNAPGVNWQTRSIEHE